MRLVGCQAKHHHCERRLLSLWLSVPSRFCRQLLLHLFASCFASALQYWLGRELVAVSVVDVLPSCLSSVYMFWSRRCSVYPTLLILLSSPDLAQHFSKGSDLAQLLSRPVAFPHLVSVWTEQRCPSQGPEPIAQVRQGPPPHCRCVTNTMASTI